MAKKSKSADSKPLALRVFIIIVAAITGMGAIGSVVAMLFAS